MLHVQSLRTLQNCFEFQFGIQDGYVCCSYIKAIKTKEHLFTMEGGDSVFWGSRRDNIIWGWLTGIQRVVEKLFCDGRIKRFTKVLLRWCLVEGGSERCFSDTSSTVAVLLASMPRIAEGSWMSLAMLLAQSEQNSKMGKLLIYLFTYLHGYFSFCCSFWILLYCYPSRYVPWRETEIALLLAGKLSKGQRNNFI